MEVQILKKPKIKIMNIEDDYTPEELLSALIEKNFADFKDKYCKVNFIYKHPLNKMKVAFVELEPILFNKIMIDKKLYIGLKRCTVYEHVFAINVQG